MASVLTRASFLALLLVAWHLSTSTGLVSSFFLPRPDKVFQSFRDIILDGEAFEDLRVTLFEFLFACPVAGILGTLVGYLVGRGPCAARVFEPIFAGLYAVPMIVFYPISILYLGIGPGSKIAHGALFGFFPICLNTIQAFSRVDPVLLRLARSMGASRWRTLRRILIPAALPTIIGGLRLGFMLTFLAIIGGETISSLAGLGHRIVWYAEGLETVKMFAYVIFVILVTVLMNLFLSLIERLGSPAR